MKAIAEMLLETKAVTSTASRNKVPPSFPELKLRCNGHLSKAKQSRGHSLLSPFALQAGKAVFSFIPITAQGVWNPGRCNSFDSAEGTDTSTWYQPQEKRGQSLQAICIQHSKMDLLPQPSRPRHLCSSALPVSSWVKTGRVTSSTMEESQQH